MLLTLLGLVGASLARAEAPIDPKSLPISSATTPADPGPFRCAVDPFVAVAAGETAMIRFTLSVPENTKLYRDQIAVEVLDAAGLKPGALVLPASHPFEDPYGGGPREVYSANAELLLPVTAPGTALGRADLTVVVSWQGCGDSMCYMPGSQTFNVPVRVTRGR